VDTDPIIEQRDRAARKIVAWRRDPIQFVRDNFGVEPYPWQAEVLRRLPTEPQIMMKASKGPGKTTTEAWAGWWILACFYDAQGIALAVTEDNLKDNLWKELAYWYDRSEILKREFEVRAERIVHREREKTWWLSARSFAQSADSSRQASTLAGLHGAVCFVLLDETGDMPAGVIPAAKGIFATRGQRGWVIGAGNPSSVDGALYYAAVTDASQWYVVNISGDPDDPNRAECIDIDWARREIEALGRDNPWVMVNILGQFPPTGANQLIGPNTVEAAMQRRAGPLAYQREPIVWGLDPAYTAKADGDEAVLARRQGVMVEKFQAWRGLDGLQLADTVAFLYEEARKKNRAPVRIFVDKGGVGVSAYDRLRQLGFANILVGVDFGGKAIEHTRYPDRRTEMWIALKDWMPYGCLPEDRILREELPAPRYEFRRRGQHTKFVLESKADMKARGKKSPNRADALALTFASPVVLHTTDDGFPLPRVRRTARSSYDPFAFMDKPYGGL